MTTVRQLKKVIRIIARLNIGGPAVHTIMLTGKLDRGKYDSVLITGSLGKNEGDMSYLAEQNSVRPITIPELGRAIHWTNDIAALWKIYRLFCKEKPDIVHTHTAKAGTLGRIAGILYCLRNKIFLKPPCIFIHTFHGHVLHSYFSKIKTIAFLLIEKSLARFTDAIVVISERQKKDIVERYKIADEKKTHIIPLGFDLAPFFHCEGNNKRFKKEFCLDDDIITIGIIGRLVPVKNHKLFIDAAKMLCNVFDKLAFIIVGDGELREELLSYTEKLKLQNRIIFAGWRRDIDSVYDGMDIVALTSLNEGTPVSLIEAMASKKPVIATDVGGVGDMFSFKKEKTHMFETDKFSAADGFRIGENGILVTQHDKESFGNGLKLLISRKNIRDGMGENGREFVEKKFALTRLINDVEALYKMLTAN